MAKSDAQKLAEVLASARPVQRPTLPTDADPESRLTPDQRTAIDYSRDVMASGAYQVNPGNDPSITSFKGAIDPTPEGDFINYPLFVDGKVMTDRKAALQRAFDYEEKTGKKFARYPTVKDADWGEMKVVHPIMDADSQKILATPEAQKRLRNAK
jgi:hypothetical protein